MIHAILMNGDLPVQEFQLMVCTYGLYAYINGVENEELEQFLRGRVPKFTSHEDSLRQELATYGDERPEGYIYAYAVLQQFQSVTDDIWVSFPNQDYFSLYPADESYHRVDILNKERKRFNE